MRIVSLGLIFAMLPLSLAAAANLPMNGQNLTTGVAFLPYHSSVYTFGPYRPGISALSASQDSTVVQQCMTACGNCCCGNLPSLSGLGALGSGRVAGIPGQSLREKAAAFFRPDVLRDLIPEVACTVVTAGLVYLAAKNTPHR